MRSMRFFWKKSNKGEHAKSGPADEAKAVHVGQLGREVSATDPCKNQNRLGLQIGTALTTTNDQNPNVEEKGEHQLVADLENVDDSDLVQLPKLAPCAVSGSNFDERTGLEGSTPPEASCSAEVAPNREPPNDGIGLYKNSHPKRRTEGLHSAVASSSPSSSRSTSSDPFSNEGDAHGDVSSFEPYWLPRKSVHARGLLPPLAGNGCFEAPVSKWQVDVSKLSGARRALRASSTSLSGDSPPRSSSGSPPPSPPSASSSPLRGAPSGPGCPVAAAAGAPCQTCGQAAHGQGGGDGCASAPGPCCAAPGPAAPPAAAAESRGAAAAEAGSSWHVEVERPAGPSCPPALAPPGGAACVPPRPEGLLPALPSDPALAALVQDALAVRAWWAERAAAALEAAARLDALLWVARSYTSAQALSAAGPPQQALEGVLAVHEQMAALGRTSGASGGVPGNPELAAAWVEAALAGGLASPPPTLHRGPPRRSPPPPSSSGPPGAGSARGPGGSTSTGSGSGPTLSGAPPSLPARTATPRLSGSVTTTAAPPRTPPLARIRNGAQAGGLADGAAEREDLRGTDYKNEGAQPERDGRNANLQQELGGTSPSGDREEGAAAAQERPTGGSTPPHARLAGPQSRLGPIQDVEPHGGPNVNSSASPAVRSGEDASGAVGRALEAFVRTGIEEQLVALAGALVTSPEFQNNYASKQAGRGMSGRATIDSFALLHRTHHQLGEIASLSTKSTLRLHAATARKQISNYVMTQVARTAE